MNLVNLLCFAIVTGSQKQFLLLLLLPHDSINHPTPGIPPGYIHILQNELQYYRYVM